MKNFLIIISALSIIVIAGSIFYYFVVFLPQQNDKPIRMQLDTKSLINDINDQLICELGMQNDMISWLEKKCPFNNNITESFDCRIQVMLSSEFKQKFNCLEK